jgi:hypothetical protein
MDRVVELERGEVGAELFADLAADAFFSAFACFRLAAREVEDIRSLALAHEQEAAVFDDCDGGDSEHPQGLLL